MSTCTRKYKKFIYLVFRKAKTFAGRAKLDRRCELKLQYVYVYFDIPGTYLFTFFFPAVMIAVQLYT